MSWSVVACNPHPGIGGVYVPAEGLTSEGEAETTALAWLHAFRDDIVTVVEET